MIKRSLFLLSLLGLLGINNLFSEDKMSAHSNTKTEEAVFAMGCFWCGESEFRDHKTGEPYPGILSLRVGYVGGTLLNPTYHNHEGYKEGVKIVYDPSIISFDKLSDIFWHNIDPFDAKGQFCDKGFPYTSAIFYTTESQQESSKKKKAEFQNALKKEIVTEIIPFTTFHDAEEYHQNYKAKNPIRYKYYRWNCGRDARLTEVWGKTSHAEASK